MSKATKFLKNSGPVSVILSVVLSVLFVVTVVQAATTIGTNISTDGTVSVTGLSTLGNASSTQLSVFNNAYFGATATSSFSSTGALTLTNALTYGGITLSNAVTGTGNMVLSASPTLTGLTSLGQASTTLFSNTDTAYFGGTATSTFSSAGALTIAGGTAILKHLSATASLNFPIIGANSCQSLTITVTGAADGDTVALGVPTALANASSTFAVTGFVSAANTVTARICQVATSASSDPAAATVRADVWQH